MMRHCLTVFILKYGTDSVGLETDVLLPFQVWHSGSDIHIAAYECKSAYNISDRKKNYICS